MLKKALAIVLVFTMLFSVCGISASALAPAAASDTQIAAKSASIGDQLSSYFYFLLDKLLNWLLSYLNKYSPKLDYSAKEDYVPVDFYEGTEDFDSAADSDGKWSVGYSTASLIEGQDILDGKHYMGGSLSFLEPKVCTGVTDDQRVRTFAISDGSDGIVVYAVLDAYALCSGDVLAIRELLREYAEENNIISINVSTLHQHSCIDTLGMNGELIRALVQNPAVLQGMIDTPLHSGRNPEFMENLHQTVALTIKNAVESMQTGSLYYGTANAADLIRDKREPMIMDTNLNRLRFDPDDESKTETWIVTAGIHCVGMGIDTTEVSGDYPYYVDKALKEQLGVNFVFLQGAQLAITTDGATTSVEGNTRQQNVMAYANELVRRLIAIDNDEAVAPLLNIRLQQVYLPVDNQVLTLCANLGIFDTTVVKVDDGKFEMVSEIGYMEIGNDLAYFLAPGELAPEIAYGGAISADDSWNGLSWDYPSIQEYIQASGRKLLVLGLTNDEVGYILTDNDYRSLFTENEEINATSGTAGSTIIESFMALYDGVQIH